MKKVLLSSVVALYIICSCSTSFSADEATDAARKTTAHTTFKLNSQMLIK